MEQILEALRARKTLRFAAIGAIAGLASILPLYGMIGANQLDNARAMRSALGVPVLLYLAFGGPAAVFGVVVGSYLARTSRISSERAIVFAILCPLSVNAAFWASVVGARMVNLGSSGLPKSVLMALLFAWLGALTAGILIAGLRATLGLFQDWRAVLWTIVGCGLSGLVCWEPLVPVSVILLLLFGLWHAVFAAGLSFGVETGRPTPVDTYGPFRKTMHDRHTLQLAGIGVAAAAASLVLLYVTGLLLHGGLTRIVLDYFHLLGVPGAVFGISAAFYLARNSLITTWQAAGLAVLCPAANSAVMLLLLHIPLAWMMTLSETRWIDGRMAGQALAGSLGAGIAVVGARLILRALPLMEGPLTHGAGVRCSRRSAGGLRRPSVWTHDIALVSRSDARGICSRTFVWAAEAR